jgi:hypothetical protein
MLRWLPVLVLLALVTSGATEARAQVFKPRTGKAAPAARTTATTAGPGAKKPAPAVAAPAAASSKKPTRATGPTPRRVVTAPPAKKSRTTKRHADANADDDDVKITDDD